MNYKFTTPIKMPRGTHYGSNYWMFESKKIHRCVTAYSNLEYENLLTLEMNPEVEYYCEQPYSATVFVGGKEYKTIFDAVSYTHLDVYKRQVSHTVSEFL